MKLPFSVDEFMAVFGRFNEDTWPAPVVLYAAALAALVSVLRGTGDGRVAAGVLALLWAWAGVAYHWLHFSAINGAAWIFGGLFLLQSALFIREGLLRGRMTFGRPRDVTAAAGLIVIAYALVGYPLLGAALGHRYPEAPTFGAPCPTTLFTLGMIVLMRKPVPSALLIIPIAWSLVSVSAALALGIREDLGLVAAAGLVVWTAVRARRSSPVLRGAEWSR